jgi:hypothetical protein
MILGQRSLKRRGSKKDETRRVESKSIEKVKALDYRLSSKD